MQELTHSYVADVTRLLCYDNRTCCCAISLHCACASELLFCTLASFGAWESTTESLLAIQQRCQTSPACRELWTVPNPLIFLPLLLISLINSSKPPATPQLKFLSPVTPKAKKGREKRGRWPGWQPAGLGTGCSAGNTNFPSSSSWDMAWEGRADAPSNGARAPPKISSRANPGETSSRKSIC